MIILKTDKAFQEGIVEIKGHLLDLQELKESIERALFLGSDVSEEMETPEGNKIVFEVVVLMEKQNKKDKKK